jgi:tetratricopeptide (TPR) repeat protein
VSALRTLIAALASLALLAPFAAAQGTKYEQALAAYQAADYTAARELWLATLAEEGAGAPSRAAVLYDLGNVAYRRKKPLEAAAWYAASLKLEPRDRDAWHNLELARREAGLEPADRGDLSATTRRLLTMLTIHESQQLALGVGALLALALIWEALRGGTAAKWASAALALAVLVALAPWTYQMATRRDTLFVVQPEGAPLHSEPRDQAAMIDRLVAASEVERVDALPGWVRVKRNGTVGWIKSDAALPLTAPYQL